MDAPKKDEVSKDKRKFQLPGWMVQNIERLTTTTDIDEFACSTLEQEVDISLCDSDTSSDDNTLSSSVKKFGTSESPVKLMAEKTNLEFLPVINLNVATNGMKSSNSVSPKHLSAVDAIKCEESIYSSPDSTPCATPEQSPIPQRKNSFTFPDTVQSNPQKWFYLGVGQNAIKLKQKNKCTRNISATDSASKDVDKSSSQTCSNSGNNDNSLKLTISNFDLNAISPSSW